MSHSHSNGSISVMVSRSYHQQRTLSSSIIVAFALRVCKGFARACIDLDRKMMRPCVRMSCVFIRIAVLWFVGFRLYGHVARKHDMMMTLQHCEWKGLLCTTRIIVSYLIRDPPPSHSRQLEVSPKPKHHHPTNRTGGRCRVNTESATKRAREKH